MSVQTPENCLNGTDGGLKFLLRMAAIVFTFGCLSVLIVGGVGFCAYFLYCSITSPHYYSDLNTASGIICGVSMITCGVIGLILSIPYVFR
jgi:nitrate reductase NapE component